MNTQAMNDLSRVVVWRRIMDDRSIEHATVVAAGSGYEFHGVIVAAHEDTPIWVDYRIKCDSAWHVKTCLVEEIVGAERRTLILQHDAGRWLVNGSHDRSLDGCTDVDLGISPSTNALPINRLRMAVGSSETILAAWVKFPALDILAAPQSYERLSERSYLYRNLGSDFRAIVDVDEFGLPTRYEGIWQLIAQSRGGARHASSHWSFAGALVSEGPSAELGERSSDLDWLAGCWSAVVRDYDENGTVREGAGEWWFSWVLEGRAMQDVWIVPERSAPTNPLAPFGADNRYGSTLRTYSLEAGQWRICWTNPVTGTRNELSGGRRSGDRIVLEGIANGSAIRWSFNDIRPESCLWRGEVKNGDTWRTAAEFFLTKRD